MAEQKPKVQEGTGIEKVKDAPEFYLDGIERIEDDVLLTYMKRR